MVARLAVGVVGAGDPVSGVGAFAGSVVANALPGFAPLTDTDASSPLSGDGRDGRMPTPPTSTVEPGCDAAGVAGACEFVGVAPCGDRNAVRAMGDWVVAAAAAAVCVAGLSVVVDLDFAGPRASTRASNGLAGFAATLPGVSVAVALAGRALAGIVLVGGVLGGVALARPGFAAASAASTAAAKPETGWVAPFAGEGDAEPAEAACADDETAFGAPSAGQIRADEAGAVLPRGAIGKGCDGRTAASMGEAVQILCHDDLAQMRLWNSAIAASRQMLPGRNVRPRAGRGAAACYFRGGRAGMLPAS